MLIVNILAIYKLVLNNYALFFSPYISEPLIYTPLLLATTLSPGVFSKLNLTGYEEPWLSIGTSESVWKLPVFCNPYSLNCDCLKQWLGLDVCKIDLESANSSVIEVAAMEEYASHLGLYACKTTFCNVIPDVGLNSKADARIAYIYNGQQPTPQNIQPLIGFSMESFVNIPFLASDEFQSKLSAMVSFKRSMDLHVTYNVYFPAQFFSKGAEFNVKRDELLWVGSNCGNKEWGGGPWRREFLEVLKHKARVDYLGSCLRTGYVEEKVPQCAFLTQHPGFSTFELMNECLYHHYKFYLALENTQEEDYITEKLWIGLRAGSVPIYIGAPNIRQYLPHPKAAILLDDFNNDTDLMLDYITRASQNETLYNEHIAWKETPLSSYFMDSVIKKSFDSRLCVACDFAKQELAKQERL